MLVDLSRQLEAHRRKSPERAEVVDEMLRALEGDDPFSRRRFDPGHFTASAFVCCARGQRVLLVHHRKLGRWLQPGGHPEVGDANLLETARRELVEETGVEPSRLLLEGLFDVDVHEIPATPREPPHRHYDVRFAFLADHERLRISPEVIDARWVPWTEVHAHTDERSVLRCTEALRAHWLAR